VYFTDDVPTSAVTGLQLNDPILQLDIGDLSARSAAAEPIPLFRLSTPSATDHPPPPPLPVASTRRYLANARDGPIHRPRPDSPTRHAQSLRAACEALSPSPIFLPSSPPPHPRRSSPPPSFTLRVYPVRSAPGCWCGCSRTRASGCRGPSSRTMRRRRSGMRLSGAV